MATLDSMLTLSYALDRTSNILREMVAPLKALSNQVDEVNTALLSTGRNLQDVFEKNNTLIRSLPGSLSKNLGLVTESLIEGFTDVNKNVTKLAVFERLTNQNAGKSLKQLKTLQATMRLSNDETGFLADTILKTSITYKTQSEGLIDALEKSKATLKNVSLIGGNSKELAKAITGLSARFRGDENRENLLQFINTMFSTDINKLNNVTGQGLKDILDALLDDPTEQGIMDAIQKSNQFFEGFMQNAGSDRSWRLVLLSQLESIYGELPELASQLANQQDTLEETQAADVSNFSNLVRSLTTIGETFLRPLEFTAKVANDLLLWAGDYGKAFIETMGLGAGVLGTLGLIYTTMVAREAALNAAAASTTWFASNTFLTMGKVLGFVSKFVGVVGLIITAISVFGIIKDMMAGSADETKEQTKLLKAQTDLMRSADDRANRNKVKPGDWQEISGKAISDAIISYTEKVKTGDNSNAKDVRNILYEIYNKLDEIKNASVNTGNAVQEGNSNSVKGMPN